MRSLVVMKYSKLLRSITQYWLNCAYNHQSAELTKEELRELCDYNFEDDETIYTGDFLDLY